MRNILTEEEYLRKVQEIHEGRITVLGEFKNSSTKVLVKCNVCGHKWEVAPYNTLKGNGCRKCRDRKRAKPYDKFIQEFKEIHGGNIKILSEYIDMSTPIRLQCQIDGYTWTTTPNCLIRKKATGCDECYRRRTRRTHEEFLNEVKRVHGDKITALGKYINNQTKVRLLCNGCHHEWESFHRNLIGGKQGCPECGRHNRKRKLRENYLKKVYEKFGDKIEILGEYVNNSTHILTKCHGHDVTWEVTPSTLLKSHGCSKCRSQAIRYSHEEYVQIMSKLHPNIEVLGEYINSLTKVELRCKKCGHEWATAPNSSVGKKRGCPKCAIKSLDRTHEEYVETMKEMHPNIEVLGNYVNTTVKVELRCKVCQHEWASAPANSITGSKTGCPACKESRLEKETRKVLVSHGYKLESQYSFDDLLGYYAVPLKFDFLLVDEGEVILIECQGIQHEQPVDFKGEGEEKARERFERQLEYDKMKRDYCNENGYKLIEVWHNEDVLESLQRQGLCIKKPLI